MKNKRNKSSTADFNKALRSTGASNRASVPARNSGGTHGGKSHSGPSSASPRRDFPREWRMVVGDHAVVELLKTRPRSVRELIFKKSWESSADLRKIEEISREQKVKSTTREDGYLDRLAPAHQGVVAFSDQLPTADLKSIAALDKSIVLFVDGVEDPHNFGAILRTAWLMGVSAVFAPEDRAVGLTPAVHKVACGGVEHIPVIFSNNFSQPIATLKESGYWVYGLAAGGKNTLYDIEFSQKVALIVGSEEKGMRVPTERLCDELISIPQVSAEASYNASVATAISVGETRRQIFGQKK